MGLIATTWHLDAMMAQRLSPGQRRRAYGRLGHPQSGRPHGDCRQTTSGPASPPAITIFNSLAACGAADPSLPSW
jgi:hypothetical protein